MVKMHTVSLTEAERLLLQRTVSRGTAAARTITRARILLKADESDDGPAESDAVIASTLDVGRRTVEWLRQRSVSEGVETALHDRPASAHKPCTLDGAQEARLTALACSQPPTGTGDGRSACSPLSSARRRMARWCPMNWSDARSKNHPQAASEGAVVHLAEAECRLRGPDGGCP